MGRGDGGRRQPACPLPLLLRVAVASTLAWHGADAATAAGDALAFEQVGQLTRVRAGAAVAMPGRIYTIATPSAASASGPQSSEMLRVDVTDPTAPTVADRIVADADLGGIAELARVGNAIVCLGAAGGVELFRLGDASLGVVLPDVRFTSIATTSERYYTTAFTDGLLETRAVAYLLAAMDAGAVPAANATDTLTSTQPQPAADVYELRLDPSGYTVVPCSASLLPFPDSDPADMPFAALRRRVRDAAPAAPLTLLGMDYDPANPDARAFIVGYNATALFATPPALPDALADLTAEERRSLDPVALYAPGPPGATLDGASLTEGLQFYQIDRFAYAGDAGADADADGTRGGGSGPNVTVSGTDGDRGHDRDLGTPLFTRTRLHLATYASGETLGRVVYSQALGGAVVYSVQQREFQYTDISTAVRTSTLFRGLAAAEVPAGALPRDLYATAASTSGNTTATDGGGGLIRDGVQFREVLANGLLGVCGDVFDIVPAHVGVVCDGPENGANPRQISIAGSRVNFRTGAGAADDVYNGDNDDSDAYAARPLAVDTLREVIQNTAAADRPPLATIDSGLLTASAIYVPQMEVEVNDDSFASAATPPPRYLDGHIYAPSDAEGVYIFTLVDTAYAAGDDRSGTPVAAIVIPILLAPLCLVVLFLLWRRRRGRDEARGEHGDDGEAKGTVEEPLLAGGAPGALQGSAARDSPVYSRGGSARDGGSDGGGDGPATPGGHVASPLHSGGDGGGGGSRGAGEWVSDDGATPIALTPAPPAVRCMSDAPIGDAGAAPVPAAAPAPQHGGAPGWSARPTTLSTPVALPVGPPGQGGPVHEAAFHPPPSAVPAMAGTTTTTAATATVSASGTAAFATPISSHAPAIAIPPATAAQLMTPQGAMESADADACAAQFSNPGRATRSATAELLAKSAHGGYPGAVVLDGQTGEVVGVLRGADVGGRGRWLGDESTSPTASSPVSSADGGGGNGPIRLSENPPASFAPPTDPASARPPPHHASARSGRQDLLSPRGGGGGRTGTTTTTPAPRAEKRAPLPSTAVYTVSPDVGGVRGAGYGYGNGNPLLVGGAGGVVAASPYPPLQHRTPLPVGPPVLAPESSRSPRSAGSGSPHATRAPYAPPPRHLLDTLRIEATSPEPRIRQLAQDAETGDIADRISVLKAKQAENERLDKLLELARVGYDVEGLL